MPWVLGRWWQNILAWPLLHRFKCDETGTRVVTQRRYNMQWNLKWMRGWTPGCQARIPWNDTEAEIGRWVGVTKPPGGWVHGWNHKEKLWGLPFSVESPQGCLSLSPPVLQPFTLVLGGVSKPILSFPHFDPERMLLVLFFKKWRCNWPPTLCKFKV